MTDSGSKTARVIVLLLVVALVTVAGWLGASYWGQRVADREVRAAAQDLAHALSQHEAPGDLAGAFGDLADVPVTVTAGAATVYSDDGEGTVPLSWAWQLPGGDEWGYETIAAVIKKGDAWKIAWSPELLHPDLAAGERLDLDTLTPKRGRILGADDEVLVVDRPVLHYGLDKAAIKPDQWEAQARIIADVFDLDADAFVKKVNGYGKAAFVEAIVMRAEDGPELVGGRLKAVPGARVVEGMLPLAETKNFARQILGTVGPATAEIIEKSDGSIVAGDLVGLSGLQQRYDAQLRGSPGVRVQAVLGGGDTGEPIKERTLFEQKAANGSDLRTTLSLPTQKAAEAALAAQLTQANGDSALVAIRPSTGEIVAAANGVDTILNAATAGQYAPGSTFKVVTSLALFRAGLTPESDVQCPATTVVDGRRFKNYDDYPATALGPLTLQGALANSCNTAFIDTRDKLGSRDLGEAAAALGMGVDHDLGFPAYFGSVPPAGGETEKAADQIGQGKILGSPLSMAAVAASVAAGKAVLPVLLPDHEVGQSPPSTPLTAKETTDLQLMMRAVVTDGSASFLTGLSGEVRAKTGTAEFGTTSGGKLPTHTWMIAIRGDLAVAVFVETGQSGSRTAGPVLQEFLEKVGP